MISPLWFKDHQKHITIFSYLSRNFSELKFVFVDDTSSTTNTNCSSFHSFLACPGFCGIEFTFSSLNVYRIFFYISKIITPTKIEKCFEKEIVAFLLA